MITTILCGSPTDSNFTGGTARSIDILGTEGHVNAPAPVPCSFARYGNFTYKIPCWSQYPYIVTFIFCDPASTSFGGRVFSVSINNQVVLDKFDIFSESGGVFMRPVMRSVVVVGADEMLKIVFTTNVRNAIVSAILFKPIFE